MKKQLLKIVKIGGNVINDEIALISFLKDFCDFIDGKGFEIKDILRTLAEHIAIQINKSLELSNIEASDRILLSGGGCFNGFLIERIKAVNGYDFIIPENEIYIPISIAFLAIS